MPGHVGLARDLERGACRRHRDRAAPERSGDEDFGGGLTKPVVSGNGRKRIAVGDGLAPGAEIGTASASQLPLMSRRKPARTSSMMSAAPAASQAARTAAANSAVGSSR